ncbi:MAG: OmpA family protein [Nitrospiraceae bacterium]
MSKSIASNYVSAPSAGTVAPTIIKADRPSHEVYMVGAGVLALAIGLGIFWVVTQSEEFQPTQPVKLDGVRAIPSTSNQSSIPVAPERLTPKPIAEPQNGAIQMAAVTPGLPTQLSDVRHADITFPFGRKGLTDEAKTYLAEHAAFLKRETDWGVVIQGSTDGRGSANYNKRLGLQRAETVRDYLAGLGVSTDTMVVVSLGKESSLCRDNSAECQPMNRRVHLEFLKIGATHLAVAQPAAAATAVPTAIQPLDLSGMLTAPTSADLSSSDMASPDADVSAIEATASDIAQDTDLTPSASATSSGESTQAD